MNANPRILHLCSNRWNSAITEYCLRLSQALNRESYPTLIGCLDRGFLYDRAKKLDLDVVGVDHFGVSSLFLMRSLAQRFKPDVVICYGGPESFLTRFLEVGKRIRFIGNSAHRISVLRRYQARVSLSHFDKVIFPSQYLKDLVGHSSSGLVLPFGSDSETYFYSQQTQNKIRPEVLLVGRFDPVKGHKEALSMFSWLLKLWPETQPRPFLRIIGREANIKLIQLEAEAEYLGLRLNHDVFFHDGDCDDLPHKMRNATLGLVSSLDSELICRVGVELLLSGTPVFVSGVGSLKELVEADQSFGAHYYQMNAEKRVFEFVRILQQSWNESIQIRKDRSNKAKSIYSLQSLSESIGSIFSV